MHLVILLAVGSASLVLLARFLATPSMALPERHGPLLRLVTGLAIGVAGAVILLSTQADLIPDEVETAALPIAIVAVSATLAVMAVHRTFRS